MHVMQGWKRGVVSSPHSDKHGHRVELGRHSLEAGEEGSLTRSAAVIVAHEDYNILLSRSQLHANTLARFLSPKACQM